MEASKQNTVEMLLCNIAKKCKLQSRTNKIIYAAWNISSIKGKGVVEMKKRNRITKICRLILISLAAVTSCGGIAFFISKTMALDVSFSNDAWLGFWGSIIGNVVTMLGIILTLSYENKQNNTIRRLEAQPIITLNALALNAGHTENESSYSLSVIGENNEEDLHFLLPDIEIQNIGLNFATKITLHFEFEQQRDIGFAYGYNPLTILDAKEVKQISLSLDIPKDKISKFFTNSYVKEENKLFHACYARTRSLLAQSNRKESMEHIGKIYYVTGRIVTDFEDIYGNVYKQERKATLHLVEMCDEDSFAYISFPKFSEAELIARRSIL